MGKEKSRCIAGPSPVTEMGVEIRRDLVLNGTQGRFSVSGWSQQFWSTGARRERENYLAKHEA